MSSFCSPFYSNLRLASLPLCRSGEKYAKVALDTFQLMLSQGMAVEGPAFHSVLTAQLERGDWPEVTRLLDEMVKHDTELDMEVGSAGGYFGPCGG